MFLIRGGWVLLPAMVCVITASSNDVLYEKYGHIYSKALKNVFASESITQVYNNETSVKISFACMRDYLRYTQALQNGQEWALRMFDASSKMQSGILDGNIADLGMYNECVRVRPEGNNRGIQGRHCMITSSIGPSDQSAEGSSSVLPLFSSVCVPSTCNAEDVVQIVGRVVNRLPDIEGVAITVARGSCANVTTGPLSYGGMITLYFLGAIILITVLCTICDLIERSFQCRRSIFFDIARSFSVYSNALRLLSTKGSEQSLPAIHGIRFFTILWVILGHEFMVGFLRPIVNLAEVAEWAQTWQSVYILMGLFAVDTFFALSGFLMSYIFLKEMAKGGKFNLPLYYIHRYIRLTPSFAVLILLTIYILPLVGSGPRWDTNMAFVANQCRENWWTNLLYVQNFVGADNMCLPHSWYLAVDMQLFILSPIILYPLFRWPKIGLSILGLFFAATLVTSCILAAINGYSVTLLQSDISMAQVTELWRKGYITPYTRAGPWLIGILVGYILVHKKLRLNKVRNTVGWICMLFAFAYCVYANRPRLNERFEYNVVLETIDFTFARPIWGAAVTWIIFSCASGYGGPVNAFLSLPVFFPLSRLSYCLYLIHFMLQLMKASAARTPSFFSDLSSFNRFCSTLVVSIAIAFVFSLLFESPITVLEKYLRNGRSKDRSKPTKTQDEVDAEKGVDNAGMSSTHSE